LLKAATAHRHNPGFGIGEIHLIIVARTGFRRLWRSPAQFVPQLFFPLLTLRLLGIVGRFFQVISICARLSSSIFASPICCNFPCRNATSSPTFMPCTGSYFTQAIIKSQLAHLFRTDKNLLCLVSSAITNGTAEQQGHLIVQKPVGKIHWISLS
ncbi:MAG: hypothetical protein QX198_17100, partial [Methylococcaceae bacterium]